MRRKNGEAWFDASIPMWLKSGRHRGHPSPIHLVSARKRTKRLGRKAEFEWKTQRTPTWGSTRIRFRPRTSRFPFTSFGRLLRARWWRPQRPCGRRPWRSRPHIASSLPRPRSIFARLWASLAAPPPPNPSLRPPRGAVPSEWFPDSPTANTSEKTTLWCQSLSDLCVVSSSRCLLL